MYYIVVPEKGYGVVLVGVTSPRLIKKRPCTQRVCRESCTLDGFNENYVFFEPRSRTARASIAAVRLIA